MTMNRDLFLAILSMDSYNRGYGIGLNGLGGKGSRIGTATVGEDALTLLTKGAAEAAGFYAIAYQVSGVSGIADGTTVVAFRGSDNIPGLWDIFTNYVTGTPSNSDANSGFGIAVGSPYGPQAALAIRFYQAALGDTLPSDALVTGHSLGGGLAGLVSANDDAVCERIAA
jgi:hypothetical protein